MKSLNFKDILTLNQTTLDKNEKQWLIQLGANDGVACEEYGLRDIFLNEYYNAILVEPLETEFNACIENYKNATSTLYFENIGIVPKKNNEYENIVYAGVESSFVRFEPNENIQRVKVEEFNYLIKKYKLDKIHGLFMDIEGMEHEVIENILRTVNIPISFIRYEFPHVQDQEGLDKLLTDFDFTVHYCAIMGGDKIATSNKEFPNLVL